MKLTYSDQQFVILEAGVYKATLQKIEEGTGDFGDYLRWVWEVETDDGAEMVSGLCNPILNARSKCAAWVQAHLGRELGVGEDIDLDECIDKTVNLTLTVEARKDGNGDRNRVAAVSPIRRGARQNGPAPMPDGVGEPVRKPVPFG